MAEKEKSKWSIWHICGVCLCLALTPLVAMYVLATIDVLWHTVLLDKFSQPLCSALFGGIGITLLTAFAGVVIFWVSLWE